MADSLDHNQSVIVPFANIPRTRRESLILDTPNLKVLATLSSIIEQVFHEFLSLSGKYRRYVDSLNFTANYAIDSDPSIGQTTLVYFRILTQEMEKVTPSIQVILGQPIQIDDLNPGFERGAFGRDHRKAYQRHFYTINCIVLVAAHTSTMSTELGSLMTNIITRYIPQIFSGVIISPDLNWQLGFPRHLDVTDTIQRREEIRGAAPEQIHYNEWNMPLMFEEIFLIGNPPYVDHQVLHAPEIPVPPFWSGPATITIGNTQLYDLKGRKDAIPETVGVTDPKIARVRKITNWVYEIIGMRPGTITLQAIYSQTYEPVKLEVTIER